MTTPETIAQSTVVDQLIRAMAAKASERAQQRRPTRYTLGVAIQLHRRDKSREEIATEDAWALDISRDGISLLTWAPLTVGERISVDLAPILKRRFEIAATTVHCQVLAHDTYRVGVRLI